jgi:lysophospholipase L1-like esterase
MDDVNVALVGDSIRLFSEPFVRRCLPARFKLRSPADNCRSSRNVAARIQDWVPPGTVDIVHLNCGLHDIRQDPGQRRSVTSPEEYVANLRHVFAYLADTGASVIWATSTPVRESAHGGIDSPRWYPADLVAYNRRSVELALGFGFRINDLHGRLSGAAMGGLLMPDGVHFNPAGNALIGQHVAAAIQACRA